MRYSNYKRYVSSGLASLYISAECRQCGHMGLAGHISLTFQEVPS